MLPEDEDEDEELVPASPLEPLEELVDPLDDDELLDDELVPASVAAGGFDGGGSFALVPVSLAAGAVWFCACERSSSLADGDVAHARRPPSSTTADTPRTRLRMGRTLPREKSTLPRQLSRETQG